MAQEQINFEQSPNKCRNQFYCVNTFSANSRKPQIEVIFGPLEGQNWANVAQ